MSGKISIGSRPYSGNIPENPYNANSNPSPFKNKWSAQPVPMDASGRPFAPEFVSVGDERSGLLKTPYNIVNALDYRATNAARDEALRPAGQISKWGQMALSQAQNQNAMQAAGQTRQAQNQLAMQGGLRTGARERLAQAGMRNQTLGNQAALGNIQMQDEQNRQKWLQMMPGMDLQVAQYDTNVQDKNIGRALQELNVGRGMQQNQYNEAMRAWGADKTAQATLDANKPKDRKWWDPIGLFD